MSCFVVIPCYNEERNLPALLDSLLFQEIKNIIVVDDCSTDFTVEKINNKQIILARHFTNLGQGAALRTGTEIAIAKGASAIAHFDADGQHRIEDLKKIIKIIANDNVKAIFGSRFLDQTTKFPFKKKIILWLAKIFSQKILQLNFTDPQSGLRAFKSEIYNKIIWENDDFAHCTEILSKIVKNKISCAEIPITVNYPKSISNKKIKPRINMGWKLIFYKILNKI